MKLTIHRKILLGFFGIIALMVISSSYILVELKRVKEAAQLTLSSNVQSIDLAKQLKTILYDEEGYAQKFLISLDKTYLSLYLESSRRFDRNLHALHRLQKDENERSLTNNLRSTHEWLITSLENEIEETDPEGNSSLTNRWLKTIEFLQRTLDHLIGLNQLSIGNAMSDVDTVTERSASVALILIICTLILALTIATFIARTITRPISELIKGTARFAKGSFEPVSVSSEDEMSQLASAFNDMGGEIKELNELKAEMMGQISHELKTPLQTIQIAHDILESQRLGQLNKDQRELIASIYESSQMITTFSNQYLDIAKVEAGMMQYTLQLTDIRKIVASVYDEVKLLTDRKNIKVRVKAHDKTPLVYVDRGKMSMICRNLFSNAIKYSPEGSCVDVYVAPNKYGVQLSVADQGIGIAPEELPVIFTKFYRARNSDKYGSKGIGLGLAIVKAFTEGHKGRVWAKSVIGKGSIFTVELPAAPKELVKSKEIVRVNEPHYLSKI